jgi:hypothetical protein
MKSITRRKCIIATGGVLTALSGCATADSQNQSNGKAADSNEQDEIKGWYLTNGSDVPDKWEHPTTIFFQYLGNHDWMTETRVEVYPRELFRPQLRNGVRYRMMVRSANGLEHKLGHVTYRGQSEKELVLFASPVPGFN